MTTLIRAATWDRKTKETGEVGSDADADDGYDSEVEDDFLSLQPASTNVYVFVANPNRNTVSRINVDDLSVLQLRSVSIRPWWKPQKTTRWR